MWKPYSVVTTGLISFGFSEKALVSKFFTVWPRTTQPRSPPLSFEPGSSEFCLASAAKSPPALIFFKDRRLWP